MPKPEPDLTLPLSASSLTILTAPRSSGWASEARAAMRQLLSKSPYKTPIPGIARAAQLAPITVYRILWGRSRPSLDSGLRLSRALGISPWVLRDYCLHQRKLLKENDWAMPGKDFRLARRERQRSRLAQALNP